MMRKALFIFSVLAVMVSCSKEETAIVEEPGNDIREELFSLVANSNEDEAGTTKTSIGDNNSIIWQEGDALSVFADASEDAMFTIKSGVGTTSATFSGPKPVTSTDSLVYACYPYNEDHSTIGTENGRMITFIWNGATQIATPGSFDPAKAPLFGYFANSEESFSNVTLKQVMAFVKITTDQRCKTIVLKSNSETIPLACESFEMIKDGDGNPSIFGTNKGSQSVTLSGKDGAIIEPGTYYIAVLPQAYTGGLTISFVSADDTPYSHIRENRTSITFQRKKVTNFGKFTLPIEEFNFTGGGTAESPYKISTLVELKDFVTLAPQTKWASLNYCLGADIDCLGDTLGVESFKGTFDGGNHTISNYYTRQSGRSSGLFITVRDAFIENLTVSCNGISGDYVALTSHTDKGDDYSMSPLVGSSYSSSETVFTTICNCTVIDSLNVSVPMINGSLGAIVGNVFDKIVMSGCTNNAYFKLAQSEGNYGTLSLGGIVGGIQGKDFESYAIFDRLRNNGKLVLNSTAYLNIGGIIGRVSDDPEDICLRLHNSVNSAELRTNENSSKGSFINRMGGMIGNNDSDGWVSVFSSTDPYIFNCRNKGKLVIWNNDACEGGIMGDCYDNDTKVYNCANTGSIEDVGRDTYRVGHGTMCGGQPDIFSSKFGYFYYCHWTNTQMLLLSSYTGSGTAEDYEYQSGCSREDPLTAEKMNEHYKCITLAPVAFNYCQWKGSSEDGSLDLDF